MVLTDDDGFVAGHGSKVTDDGGILDMECNVAPVITRAPVERDDCSWCIRNFASQPDGGLKGLVVWTRGTVFA